MKLSVVFSVCWLIISVSGDSAEKVAAATKEVKIDKPDLPPEPEDVTTTLKPAPTPAPTPAPPTSPPTTPPTTEPTTQKTPTTTPTTTTTSTETPKPPPPTPTPDPTPAPTPGPAPAPKTGTWVVNGANHTTCIIIKMAAQLNVTYLSKDNKTMHQLVTLPSDNTTSVTGDCGVDEQFIKISWNSSVALNDSLVLHFNKNGTKYSLHHIEAYLAPQDLPNYQFNTTLMMIHNISEYPIAVSNSYRCAKALKLNLNATAPNTTAVFGVSDLQFQAFRSDNTTAFGFAEDCAFETQDVVPIAVGCALIALVIIVLVAYLVGRRRSQARGYRSM